MYNDPTFRFRMVDYGADGDLVPGAETGAGATEGIHLDVEAGLLRWQNIPRAQFRIFAFETPDETDPEYAVATGYLPALPVRTNGDGGDFRQIRVFDLAELELDDISELYFRVQALPEVDLPVRGQDGVYWGEPSPLSYVATPGDPFAGAASWALAYLPAAYDEGLLSERMFGAWEDSPTRLEAASDIVRFAQVFTGAADLEALYEYLGLDFDDAEPFPDTDDENARFLKAAGISTGNQYGYFVPADSFTRAAMVVMIYRLAMALELEVDGFPLGSDSFTDVPDWPQHEEAIGWAASVGITEGIGGGLFGSLDDLQNQHIALFALRALRSLSQG
jgi:hypothetical protein